LDSGKPGVVSRGTGSAAEARPGGAALSAAEEAEWAKADPHSMTLELEEEGSEEEVVEAEEAADLHKALEKGTSTCLLRKRKRGWTRTSTPTGKRAASKSTCTKT